MELLAIPFLCGGTCHDWRNTRDTRRVVDSLVSCVVSWHVASLPDSGILDSGLMMLDSWFPSQHTRIVASRAR